MRSRVASRSATEVDEGDGIPFELPFGVDTPEVMQAVKTRLKAKTTVIRAANDLLMKPLRR